MDKSKAKTDKQQKVKINIKDTADDDTLDLSLSELTEVPVKEIGNLKRVTILDLSNNQISSLGKNFGILSRIVKLDLSKNQIRSLPEDFGKLKNLRHLDLYNNRIEHLPLSFGDLHNLRYLDLKANPLTPALAKIVGPCLTTKDCKESARNTVKFLAKMQIEVEKAKEKYQDENDALIEEIDEYNEANGYNNTGSLKKQVNQKSKKKSKNKPNNKGKNRSNNNSLDNDTNKNNSRSPKTNSTKENHPKNKNKRNYDSLTIERKSRSVFKTLFVFFFLLIINAIMLYVMTVKNPELADKLVNFIPKKYHEPILSKVEDLKLNFLRVSDWLQKFKTPFPNNINNQNNINHNNLNIRH